MSGKTEQTTRSRTDPARWLMPHVQSVLGSAANLYGSGTPTPASSPFPFSQGFGGGGGIFGRFMGGNQPAPQGAPQSTVAPFSPTTEAALSGIEQRATGGNPLYEAGSQQLLDTISGQYLTPESNPYLRQYGDYLAGHVQDRVNAEFSKAGRYGSGAHAGTTAREIGGLLSGFYSDAYGRERGLQHGATGMAPAYAQEGYRDLYNLLGAGEQRDVKAQQVVDDPYQRILRYLSIISGVPQGTESYGKTTQTSTPGALDILGTLGGIAAIPMSGGTSLLGSLIGGGAGAAGGLAGAGAAGALAGAGGSAGLLAALASDPALKTDVTPIEGEEVLQKFRTLPVSDYRYKPEAQQAMNLPEARTGPMATDYGRLFGGDSHTIDMGDALGNVMAAIKALEARTRHDIFGSRRAA